jgi:ribonuclease-3
MDPDSREIAGNAGLEERIGYVFSDPSLLARALTRLAYGNEQRMPEGMHMDALATLGDAVISLVVLDRLIREGAFDKGSISLCRADSVNMTRLRTLGEEIGLEAYVAWGKGERAQHVWTSGRVLAECFEAVIGAVYLDGGLEAASAVLGHLGFPDGALFGK